MDIYYLEGRKTIQDGVRSYFAHASCERLTPHLFSRCMLGNISQFSVMASRILQHCVRSLGRPSLRLCSCNLAVRAAVAPVAAIHRPLSVAVDSRRTRWLGQSRVSVL